MKPWICLGLATLWLGAAPVVSIAAPIRIRIPVGENFPSYLKNLIQQHSPGGRATTLIVFWPADGESKSLLTPLDAIGNEYPAAAVRLIAVKVGGSSAGLPDGLTYFVDGGTINSATLRRYSGTDRLPFFVLVSPSGAVSRPHPNLSADFATEIRTAVARIAGRPASAVAASTANQDSSAVPVSPPLSPVATSSAPGQVAENIPHPAAVPKQEARAGPRSVSVPVPVSGPSVAAISGATNSSTAVKKPAIVTIADDPRSPLEKRKHGIALVRGDGVFRDREEGHKWLEEAAREGDVRSYTLMGDLISDISAPAQEQKLAYYRQAAAGGDGSGAFAVGLMLTGDRAENPPPEATDAMHRAFKDSLVQADAGDGRAMRTLARIYEEGIPGLAEADKAKAFEWAMRGAKAQNEIAMRELGRYCEEGIGCEKDMLRAIYSYQSASDGGDPTAGNRLGQCYLQGIGVAKSRAMAYKYYLASALAGNPAAMYMMGMFLREGIGTEEIPMFSTGWFEKSAAVNFPSAFIELGKAYYSGYGTAADLGRAKQCFLKAQALGNRQAEAYLDGIRSRVAAANMKMLFLAASYIMEDDGSVDDVARRTGRSADSVAADRWQRDDARAEILEEMRATAGAR